MGLGVLEDRALQHVPGTTRYFDDPDRPQVAGEEAISRLKCDTSGPVPIILVPQPSDDPNDPLNWPLWKRDVILLVLSVISVFATALGPILAANTLTLSLMYGRPFTDVALLTGYYLLGVGAAGIFFVPSARIWGKRHLFIFGTVLLIVSSAWAGASGTNYRSMIGARVVQGIATAPFEALVNAVVGDLYFVHERGKRMALTNLAVFGGAFFTPIVVGKITHTIGWPWTFYLEAIFCAACLPLVIFFAPETAFRRSSHLNTDLVTESSSSFDLPLRGGELGTTHDATIKESNVSQLGTPHSPSHKSEEAFGTHSQAKDSTGASNPKRSFTQSLMPVNGRVSDDFFLDLLVRPFPLFAHPAIIWGCLIQGTLIGWTVFIGIILAAIFELPPLYFDDEKVGYLFSSAFIGSIIGFILSGIVADPLANFLTKRNKGVYEPEFRIPLVALQLFFGAIGLYGFGFTADNITR